MAISEDTAALVAAQLTVAWATRTKKPSLDHAGDAAEILEQFLRFKGAVTEVPIRSAKQVPISGV